MFTSGRSMKSCIQRFLGMLNPFLTGSTLANKGIPLKIKKPKMAALRIANFDILSELWFYLTYKHDLGVDL